MKNYNTVGLDIGNKNSKSNTGIIFDSRISNINSFNESEKFTVDGTTYYLGEGEYDTTFNKIDKKNYINLLYILLSKSSINTANYVGLGLPLCQWQNFKDPLKEKVMKNDFKIVNGKPFQIVECEVFPEGVASLDDEWEGVVIDIGGLTTDCALVYTENNERHITEPISIPRGTINLFEDFITRLNNKFGLDLQLRDAERKLKSGLSIGGQIQDIGFALQIFDDFYENLLSKLNTHYSLKTENISMTGGGSKLFYERLKKGIGNNVSLQDDYLFANANAYYDLMCSMYEE